MRSLTRKAEQSGFVCMAFALLLCALNANADVIEKEDLSACKLPCGEVALPSRGAPGARDGHIFRFSDKRFSHNPFEAEGKRPESIKALFQRLSRENVGDLWYSSAGGSSFVAVSGRIADLGKHYLYELSGRNLPRPPEVFSATERHGKTGEAYPGVLEGVKEGHCYLVETADGKYALLRLVTMNKGERSAIIQYVYQPDGSRTFQIPEGKIIKSEGRDEPLTEVPAPAVRRPEPRTEQTLPDIDTHLQHRTKLIAQLMNILRDSEDRLARSLAVHGLGQMRAAEAAPVIASMIDAPLGPLGVAATELRLEDLYACVPALVNIGKPGAAACLAELIRLDDPENQQAMKVKLLCKVLVGVEGKDVAEFIIKREMEKRDEAHKATYEMALKCLND